MTARAIKKYFISFLLNLLWLLNNFEPRVILSLCSFLYVMVSLQQMDIMTESVKIQQSHG